MKVLALDEQDELAKRAVDHRIATHGLTHVGDMRKLVQLEEHEQMADPITGRHAPSMRQPSDARRGAMWAKIAATSSVGPKRVRMLSWM